VVWFLLAVKEVLDRALDLFSVSIFVGLGVTALSFFQSPVFLQLIVFLLPLLRFWFQWPPIVWVPVRESSTMTVFPPRAVAAWQVAPGSCLGVARAA
jgi:hypothetical protein